LAGKCRELESLEQKAGDPNLWQDSDSATATLQKLAQIKESIQPILDLQKRASDLSDLSDLATEDESGESMEAELAAEAVRIEQEIARFEMENLFSGEHDSSDAILEINAGAGGTDACDWVQ